MPLISRVPRIVSVPARDYPILADGYKPRHDVSRDPPARVGKDGRVSQLTPRDVDRLLDSLDDFASFMESKWLVYLGPLKIWQCGYDTVLGIVPGVGDAFISGGHIFTNARARSLKLSKWRRTRMLTNSFWDVVIGLIPVVGGIFNAWFACNRRNVNLILRAYGRVPQVQPTVRGDRQANAPTEEDLAAGTTASEDEAGEPQRQLHGPLPPPVPVAQYAPPPLQMQMQQTQSPVAGVGTQPAAVPLLVAGQPVWAG